MSPHDVHYVRFPLPPAVDGGDQKIFEHRQILEGMRYLERSPNAGDAAGAWRCMGNVMAVKVNGAGIGLEQSGNQIEQRRFPGSVRPDDAERFAPRYFEHYAVDRFERAE